MPACPCAAVAQRTGPERGQGAQPTAVPPTTACATAGCYRKTAGVTFGACLVYLISFISGSRRQTLRPGWGGGALSAGSPTALPRSASAGVVRKHRRAVPNAVSQHDVRRQLGVGQNHSVTPRWAACRAARSRRGGRTPGPERGGAERGGARRCAAPSGLGGGSGAAEMAAGGALLRALGFAALLLPALPRGSPGSAERRCFCQVGCGGGCAGCAGGGAGGSQPAVPSEPRCWGRLPGGGLPLAELRLSAGGCGALSAPWSLLSERGCVINRR